MNNKFQTAIHEAGHILIGKRYGRSTTTFIQEVEGIWVGCCEGEGHISTYINSKLDKQIPLNSQDKELVNQSLKILLSGKIAEEVYMENESKGFGPNVNNYGASQDVHEYAHYEINILKRTTPYQYRSEDEENIRLYLKNNYNELKEIANKLYETHSYIQCC